MASFTPRHMSPIDGSDKSGCEHAGSVATAASPTLHVVLVEPEIALNTGSIGRTCVAIGAMLWLVRPLGFRLDDRHVRRAGLDYWEYLHWQVVDRLDDVVAALGRDRVWSFSTKATRAYTDARYLPRRRAGLWSGEPRSSRALVKGMWGTSPADPDASGGPELESRERRGRRRFRGGTSSGRTGLKDSMFHGRSSVHVALTCEVCGSLVWSTFSRRVVATVMTAIPCARDGG